jgi:glycine dehydrogenase subunit 2
MIEPTETENKETLDQFCDDLIELAGLVDSNPEALTSAPVTLPVTRLDETKAARSMELTDDL